MVKTHFVGDGKLIDNEHYLAPKKKKKKKRTKGHALETQHYWT